MNKNKKPIIIFSVFILPTCNKVGGGGKEKKNLG
jgi:hypothetical protein